MNLADYQLAIFFITMIIFAAFLTLPTILADRREKREKEKKPE